MPIQSAHNMLDRSGSSAGSRSVYTYLFPDLAGDDRVDAVLLPVGDGMTLARRLK